MIVDILADKLFMKTFFVNSLATQSYNYMKQTQNGGELADDENNYHLDGPTSCEYENSSTKQRFVLCIK